MRTPTDALRSLKKYAALALGSDWEVRLTTEEGSFTRPFARVGSSTPANNRPRGARHAEIHQRFIITCYPKEKKTPDEARIEAAAVEDLLFIALSQGVHEPSMAPSRGRAHPSRIPLYDYGEIALNAAATEDDRAYNDFMWVDGAPDVGCLVDPDDDLLYIVTADIPLWWTRSVAITRPGTTLESVTSAPDFTT